MSSKEHFIPRLLDLAGILKNKSCFLFGPRQTGKTSLVAHQLSGCRVYNLLDSPTFTALSRNPGRIGQEMGPKDRIVVIDEIQKLPVLMDEVHRNIEEKRVRFLLTGSSARKLRRGGVNLLGGRARSRTFHPFVYQELKGEFDLAKALNNGLIPSIYFSDSPSEDLAGYAGDYLKEEIAAEGLTRNIPAFSRFLEVAALCNSRMINFTEIANDAQVARTTVHEYFHILKDTLIGFELPAWKKSLQRKPISTSKFYFFDSGVVRHLQQRSPTRPRSPEWGSAFETWLFHELKTFVDYIRGEELFYWKSKSGFEVDFIIGDSVGVEVKGKEVVHSNDLKGLLALREERRMKHYILVCEEKGKRRVNGIEILPWKVFLEELWERKWI